jgi:hypothetical protein
MGRGPTSKTSIVRRGVATALAMAFAGLAVAAAPAVADTYPPPGGYPFPYPYPYPYPYPGGGGEPGPGTPACDIGTERFQVKRDGELEFVPGLVCSDPDGDPIIYHLEVEPQHGDFEAGSAPGILVYRPDTGYVGPDSFAFHVSDGVRESAVYTVNIDVVDADQAVSQVALPGEPVATGTPGTASASDPVITSVTSPTGGLVSIVVGAAGDAPPTGFQLLGTPVDITAPPATDPADPIVLVFELAASELPDGVDETNLAILRDGVPAGPCTGPAGSAIPTPCVSERTRLPGDGNVVITVLTMEASRWMLAKAPPPDPGGGNPPGGNPPGGNPPGGNPPGGNPPGGNPPGGGPPPRGPRTPTAPSDVTPPEAGLRAIRRQKLRAALRKGLRVRLRSDEPATLTVRARLDRRTARRLKLKNPVARVTARITDGQRVVKLRFTGKAKRKLRRLKRVRLTTTVTAVDAAGNSKRTPGPRLTLRR